MDKLTGTVLIRKILSRGNLLTFETQTIVFLLQLRRWLSYPSLPATFRLGFKFKGKKKITIPTLSHMLFNKRNFNPAMQAHPVVPCKSTFEHLENPCIAFTSKVGQNTLTMSSRTGETFGRIPRVSLAIPYCAPFFLLEHLFLLCFR